MDHQIPRYTTFKLILRKSNFVMEPTPDAFRRTIGSFATGVTVVTLGDPPHGMTANAVSSVSLEPPLLLVCVDHDTTTYERLKDGEDGFCVNVLAADQQPLGEYFANMTELDDPFENRPTRTGMSGSPIFEDSLAYLDCSVHSSHRAGDHTIYVGAVNELDVLRDDAEALTFFKGQWGALSDD